MARAHDPLTPEGRDGLARVIAYERARFRGVVRATVAERLLRALRDQHARPALQSPGLAREFDRIAHFIAIGDVAGVAVKMADLVGMARASQAKRLRLAEAERRLGRRIVNVELPE